MNAIQTKGGSISFDDLLVILNPPELDSKKPIRPLRWKGNLARCLDHLNRTFPELIARVMSPEHLSEIISPYLNVPEDERGREISGHAATGRLPDHNPVYVILTPHGLASSDPEVKNLFRAVIFILAITQVLSS